MKDSIRESLSYFGLYRKMLHVKKEITPRPILFGNDPQQYLLYYEPKDITSEKVIIWVHSGGWNAGSPKLFDFVGQCVAKNGYRFFTLGYRLSPKNKYPCQIEDVCSGYHATLSFLISCDRIYRRGRTILLFRKGFSIRKASPWPTVCKGL